MEVVLTLQDVNAELTHLEQKYGFATDALLQDERLQQRVSPDDLFNWCALADHLRNLQEDQFDRSYLERIRGEGNCAKDRSDLLAA